MARPDAQVRLADEWDRAAFRSWLVLLADAPVRADHPRRHRLRGARSPCLSRGPARAPGPKRWCGAADLPFAPQFADVRSAPKPTDAGWPLFRVAAGEPPRFAEFADAKTLATLNARPLGRNTAAARAGDLLRLSTSPARPLPDHVMGRSWAARSSKTDGADWVEYDTGPSDAEPGEVRKMQLATLARHPSPRWRPVPANPNFVGVFRLVVL